MYSFVVQSTKTQYLVEVEFCLDKTFKVIACPTNSRVYPNTAAVSQSGLVASMVQKQQIDQEEQCNDAEEIAYPTIKTSSVSKN